ncbi:acyl carrier protein [Nitratireductor rhodophyticola]|uniref:acyl carrier protein n=1 Tax=Nitratireductor rhodophyticola TaxID=2854036 RepID=UPI00300B47A0
MGNYDKIYNEIKSMIYNEFSIYVDSINADSVLNGDIFDEKLDVVELILNVENKYRIGIDENIITDKTTFGDLVKIVEASL